MFTLNERIRRLKANAEIQWLMGAWSGYLSGGQYDRLLTLFSEDADVWVSMPWGTYRGTEGIRRLYHGLYGALYRNGDEGKPGVLTVAGVNTPRVDVAGAQASASWISPGVFTTEDAAGPRGLQSYWSWKQLRADLVLGGEGWKLLHLQIRPLMTTQFEKSWTVPQALPWETIPAGFAPDEPEMPPLPELVYRSCPLQNYTGTAWEQSPDARVLRLELTAEAQRLMGEFTARINTGRLAQIPELFAANTPTVRVETIQGVYDGYSSIKRLYDSLPGMPAGHTGFPPDRIQSLETPIIRAAGDCQTARGVWVSPGFLNVTDSSGSKKGCWSWRKYAADFIMENDTLKIWHLHEYGLFESQYGSEAICASGTFSQQHAADPDRAPTTPFHLSEDSVYPYTPAVPGQYRVFDPDLSY